MLSPSLKTITNSELGFIELHATANQLGSADIALLGRPFIHDRAAEEEPFRDPQTNDTMTLPVPRCKSSRPSVLPLSDPWGAGPTRGRTPLSCLRVDRH